MSAEDYQDHSEYEYESRNRLKFQSAVTELDAYISREETRCGGIIDSDIETVRCHQPKIIKSLTELKSALNRDRYEMKEAYQFLKKSNETMKKIIVELRTEMKACRVNIKNEFVNFENLNTDRLLSINPKCFTAGTARGK